MAGAKAKPMPLRDAIVLAMDLLETLAQTEDDVGKCHAALARLLVVLDGDLPKGTK